MGYFPVRYDSRVVIYEHKMFIRLATELHSKVSASGLRLLHSWQSGSIFDRYKLRLDLFIL